MSKKKPFALRLDESMMKALEKWAADEFRSTNGQLEWIIREALKKSGRLPKAGPERDEETI
ncbi:Arc family DNA-binding protein [Algoriphagus sp. H41]|uniref:Arc family DNA-binding protein n=1 Tax=Algoriphagus oliviformis TaxID=2811231 RepID=A0ABS3C2Q8_9BACT|nr:Arc family DNA-binding protein [Algoriphagus oliviformis]MBN7811402.1 Arc family DNA-binding protein [Algoriphagus oliviformis]